MLFRKSYRRSSMAIRSHGRGERPTVRRETAIAIDTTRIARAFYCDVLRGRQVWDSEASGNLSFMIEGARIDVTTTVAADAGPVVLSVGNPEHLAERCWDAGYSVRVDHDETGDAAMSVIDPFGRRLELVR
jgi:catechol 2,3-dioxygenase-like lactoylglutathione lyase family enzyme